MDDCDRIGADYGDDVMPPLYLPNQFNLADDIPPLHDHFIHGTLLAFSAAQGGGSGSGNSVLANTSTANNQGIMRCRVVANTSNMAGFAAPNQIIFGGGRSWQFNMIATVVNLSDGTDNYINRFGFTDFSDGATDVTDGLYYEYNQALGVPGNWYKCQAIAGVRTKQDTGIAVKTTSKTRFTIDIDPSAGTATYWIDNANAGTSSSIPTAHTGIGFQMQKVLGASSRDIQLDYIGYIPGKRTSGVMWG